MWLIRVSQRSYLVCMSWWQACHLLEEPRRCLQACWQTSVVLRRQASWSCIRGTCLSLHQLPAQVVLMLPSEHHEQSQQGLGSGFGGTKITCNPVADHIAHGIQNHGSIKRNQDLWLRCKTPGEECELLLTSLFFYAPSKKVDFLIPISDIFIHWVCEQNQIPSQIFERFNSRSLGVC